LLICLLSQLHQLNSHSFFNFISSFHFSIWFHFLQSNGNGREKRRIAGRACLLFGLVACCSAAYNPPKSKNSRPTTLPSISARSETAQSKETNKFISFSSRSFILLGQPSSSILLFSSFSSFGRAEMERKKRIEWAAADPPSLFSWKLIPSKIWFHYFHSNNIIRI